MTAKELIDSIAGSQGKNPIYLQERASLYYRFGIHTHSDQRRASYRESKVSLEKLLKLDPRNEDAIRQICQVRMSAIWTESPLLEEKVCMAFNEIDHELEKLKEGRGYNAMNAQLEAESLSNQARMFEYFGLYEEGLAFCEEAYPKLERLRTLDTSNLEVAAKLYKLYHSHAYFFKTELRNSPKAHETYGKALKLSEEILEQVPKNFKWRALVSDNLFRLGETAVTDKASEKLLTRCLEMRVELFGKGSGDGIVENYLASRKMKLGKLEEALNLAHEAVRKIDANYAGYGGWQRQQAWHRFTLGEVYWNMGKSDKAETVFRETLEIFRALLPEEFVWKPYWDSTHVLNILSELLKGEMRWGECISVQEDLAAVRMKIAMHSPGHVGRAEEASKLIWKLVKHVRKQGIPMEGGWH